MLQTSAEKIISRHCGKICAANDYVIAHIDFCLISDTTGPFAIESFHRMGGRRLFAPSRLGVFIDHATPSPNQKLANLHQLLRDFARGQGCLLFDAGEGVCHQLVIERGLVMAGQLVLGADSHTCSYGAVGALAAGVGSTDLAAVMLTGSNWLRVPQSIRINFRGRLTAGVSAKDVALRLVGMLTADGATYHVLEFYDVDAALTLEDRITICNMSVECGAKAGLFPRPADQGDAGANYMQTLEIDLRDIVPQLSCPHRVDNVCPVATLTGLKVDQVFIGSCTNGRYSDLIAATRQLAGRRIAPDVRLYIAPASRQVLLQSIAGGELAQLVAGGAVILPPGCGPCVGTLGGIPGDGDTVLSTANRNFCGRMGNNRSAIYLCSPAVAMASAIAGAISLPAVHEENQYDD